MWWGMDQEMKRKLNDVNFMEFHFKTETGK